MLQTQNWGDGDSDLEELLLAYRSVMQQKNEPYRSALRRGRVNLTGESRRCYFSLRIEVRKIEEEGKFSVVPCLIFTFSNLGISLWLCSYLTIYAVAPNLINQDYLWTYPCLFLYHGYWWPLLLLTANLKEEACFLKKWDHEAFFIFLTFFPQVHFKYTINLKWILLEKTFFLAGIGHIQILVFGWNDHRS